MKKAGLFCLGIVVTFILGGCSGGSNGGGSAAITGSPVWNAGIGFITESTTATFPTTATATDQASLLKTSQSLENGMALKRWLATQSFQARTIMAKSLNGNSNIVLSTIDDKVWQNSVKYIYLDWGGLSGVSYYNVYFLESDGKNKLVWSSQDSHANDPAYTTKAFLDLSEELAGENLTAGQYQFKVIAYNNSCSVEYPVITVSIGRLLGDFPTITELSLNKLSWKPVDGANGGYKVVIYSDAALLMPIWNSGETLLTNPTTSFGILLPAESYYAAVFAYANENGRTAEITFEISELPKTMVR